MIAEQFAQLAAQLGLVGATGTKAVGAGVNRVASNTL